MYKRQAQSLLGLPGGVTGLDVTVHDVYAAERIAQRITAATGVQADSWIRTNEQFFTAINAQQTSNTVIRAFVQRSREIGILRAMGISRGQILRLFLLQGSLLGFSGSLVGSAIGALALVLWQRFARNADGTPLFPLAFEPWLFVAALVLATIVGLAAAVAPALRASRMDPVVAIRG